MDFNRPYSRATHHKFIVMNHYDTYTPEIPYTHETATQPKQAEESVDNTKKDKKNTQPSKKERKKKIAKVKTENSFVETVKRWANRQNIRITTGLFLGFAGVYLLISFLSFFVNCVADQSAVNSNPVGSAQTIGNAGGEGGARLAELLINEGFGLGAGVIVFWFLAMSVKLLAGKPRFKSVDFTIKCFVALITVSLIIGLVTIKLDSDVNWGGYHGLFVNNFIIHFVGWSGASLLCLFMICVFFLICLRDFVNWIIRLKRARDEKRRIIAQEKAERKAKEDELARMKLQEELDAAKAGEALGKEIDDDDADASLSFDPHKDSLLTDSVDNAPLYSLDEQDDELGEKAAENPAAATESREMPSVETDVEPETVQEKAEDDTMKVNVNQIGQTDKKHYTSKEAAEMRPSYKFPPFDILRQGVEKISVDVDEQIENKAKIKKTLLDFNIPILSIEATVGPTVTLYEIVPDKGVKIAKIRSLVDDIALSLSAIGVRIIAPIPGKGTVGIEVANKDPQTVSMRTVIKSKKFQESKYELPVALGSTISNDVYIADLAKMPHLLVAGATGQGKSVGLNAIISSLLYCKSPDQLKFVMIDPKQVEFSLYAKIQNYYMAMLPGEEESVVTDVAKVESVLSSLCTEMDNRYQLLKMAHARKITEYNAKIAEGVLNPMEGHRFMPYIVVIVDEFSDLIMTSGKNVEMPIARLAQKARAVGMHVIIATQRPSTNVITGIIKANFPVRIAFKVSSGVDSKTILDTTGAQQLIGRGDMLILNNSEMVRVQCAFIDTPEVEDICDYIERQPYPPGPYMLPEPVVNGNEDSGSVSGNNYADRDSLFDEAARSVVNANIASTSSLQRRFSIGYNRAGKIMDQLEAAGIVGPSRDGKARDVLVDPNTLEDILNNRLN